MSDLTFLGAGIKFPFQFSLVSGGVTPSVSTTVSAGIEHVAQGIYQIILTTVGERFFRRTYGSSVRHLLLAPQTPEEFVDRIRVAIENHEKRVRITESRTKVGGINGQVMIDIDFAIMGANVVGNMVFPFYLETESTTPPAIGFISSLKAAS